MDKKKSETWNNFTLIDNEKAKCNFCTSSISYKGGSTANLTRHLKRKHIIQYEARKKIRSIEIIDENPDEPNETATIREQTQPSSTVQSHIQV